MLFVAVCLIQCLASMALHPLHADTIYYNGSILTMAGTKPQYIQAVAVHNNQIISTGNKSRVFNKCQASTKLIDLEGRTMLPGFIEPHTHFSLVTIFSMFASVAAPPLGNTSSRAALMSNLKNWFSMNIDLVKQTGWIVGMNYDERGLEYQQHPDRELLDQISKEYPVLLVHQSIHMGAVNSKALDMMGIDDKFVDPKNGLARRRPGTHMPTGVLEQSVFLKVFVKVLNRIPQKRLTAAFQQSQHEYMKQGFTTVTDGKTDPLLLKSMVYFAEQKKLQIDVIAYLDSTFFSKGNMFKKWSNYTNKQKYTNRFRIGGGKITLDGSIQAQTAWLSQPYYRLPPNATKGYHGYPSHENISEVVNLITKMRQNNFQVTAHANGDAAITQLINAVEISRNHSYKPVKVADYPFNFTNLDSERVVCIHCQCTTPQQTQRLKKNYIIPSYFSAHVYYWGDWHLSRTLGPQRASRLSVAGEALANNMLYTAHLDSPVVPPHSMVIVSSLVNRKTLKGVVLGGQYRLPVYKALLSITKHASFQIFQEKKKGSIEVGHLADFVILSQNPLKVSKDKLLNIKILHTIKQNKVIYNDGPTFLGHSITGC